MEALRDSCGVSFLPLSFLSPKSNDTFSVYLGLFLATMEVSIVSTALVAITDDLGDFGQSTWVVTSYLLTYTGWFAIHFSSISSSKWTKSRIPYYMGTIQ